MPTFTKTHASDFAGKLTWKPKDPSLPRLEVRVRDDGAHSIQEFYSGDKLVFYFGIKHGSKRNAPHGWVARDLTLSPRFAVEFAICNVTIDDMIRTLIDKGLI